MANDLNFTVPINFPIDELAAVLVEKLQPLFNGIRPKETPPAEVYRTRKETANQLNVSLPTLNEYTKRGLIKSCRFGIRVMYRQSDIDGSLTQINYGRD